MDKLSFSLVNKSSSITEILIVFLVILLSSAYIYSFLKRKNYPPGPSGIPFLGYLPFLGAEPHKTLLKLSQKNAEGILGVYLGNKFTIVLNDWTSVKEVLTHNNALDRNPKLFEVLPYAGFGTTNGKEWIEQRRFCFSSVRDLGVGRGPWETTIMEAVQRFIKELQKTKGKPVEISHNLCTSVSSNILSFLIGRRLRKEEEPEKVQLSVDFADISLKYLGPSMAASLVPGLKKFCEVFKIAGYDRAKSIINSFSQFVKDEISRHKTSPEFEDVNDFINSYLRKLSEMTSPSNEIKHYFCEETLQGNVTILFLGASDTLISSLGWLFRLMAKHPDVQQKVYKELMTVFGKDEVARYEERHKVPYTFAVLMEAQRFSSIVPLSTTRSVSADFSVRGYTIPKGANVVANLWALHYDTKYWDEPEKFKPERFLLDEGKTLVKAPPSFAPFSAGRRNCPGETIAYMEILFYFSEIIKKFEISTPSGQKPEFNIIPGLVQALEPQPLCFKERPQ